MNSRDLYQQLSLTSALPRPEQFKLAWEHLTSTDLSAAWNAKCWLTYRAISGELPMEDWRKHVSPNKPLVPTGPLGARWETSQLAAEVYLHILKGTPQEAAACALAFRTAAYRGRAIELWPYAAFHLLRIDILDAYAAELAGALQQATLEKILRDWRTSLSFVQLSTHPRRLRELSDDLEIMGALVRLAESKGWTSNNPTPRAVPNGMFLDCLIALGNKAPDASLVIWKTEGSQEKRLILGHFVPFGGIFVELGVARGAFAEALLKEHSHLQYIGIDKWNDERHPAIEMDMVHKRLEPFASRFLLIRQSFATSNQLSELDLVYVDGYAHTGQDDGKTLELWWPKVKEGGYLAGHDYDAKEWPLTFAAVNRFAEAHNLPVSVIDGDKFPSWFVKKPIA